MPPKVRSTLAALAVLVLVTAIPAEAAIRDGDGASVATGTAIPDPSIVSAPGINQPRAPSGTDDRANAAPTAGRWRGGGPALHAETTAVPAMDAIALAHAGDHGTALPGDDVVAASERPRSSSDAAGGSEPPHARIDALPDPGSLQVFGLGLVIIATVAGTWRRKTDMSF